MRKTPLTAALLFIALTTAASHAKADPDEGPIFEAGPAMERAKGKPAAYGASVALEHTPIENWLEIEYGLTLLQHAGRRSAEADILFKKPFRLTDTAEFMIGAGPTFARTFSGTERGTSHGAEFVLDFMFWPAKNVGWYVEPSYGIGLGHARGEHSVGGSTGILLRWQ